MADRRYPTEDEKVELADLYHLARVPGKVSRYDRMLWAAEQFQKAHPDWTAGNVWKSLEEALEHPIIDDQRAIKLPPADKAAKKAFDDQYREAVGAGIREARKEAGEKAEQAVKEWTPDKVNADLSGLFKGERRGLGGGNVPDVGSEDNPVKSPYGLNAYRKNGFWWSEGYSMSGSGKMEWHRVTDPGMQAKFDSLYPGQAPLAQAGKEAKSAVKAKPKKQNVTDKLMSEVIIYGGLPMTRSNVYHQALEDTGEEKAAGLFAFGGTTKLAPEGMPPISREEFRRLVRSSEPESGIAEGDEIRSEMDPRIRGEVTSLTELFGDTAYKVKLADGSTMVVPKTDAVLLRTVKEKAEGMQVMARPVAITKEDDTAVVLLVIEQSRSPLSRSLDESQSNAVTIDPDDPRTKIWKRDPRRMDIQGIDTPKPRAKSGARSKIGASHRSRAKLGSLALKALK